jgi:phospholipid/cholesterol/gamma-HCH transport system permease protein
MATATTELEAAPAVAGPAVAGAKPGPVLGFLAEAGELSRFAARSAVALGSTPRYASEVLRQSAGILRGSWFLLIAMNMFLGVAVVNFGFFFLRSIGAGDFIGVVTGYADSRQLATTMFGYVFTAKVCTGMAAELGAMKINEEIDAYEATGVDPMRFVVATRILAVVLFVPVGAALSILGETLGGYLASVVIIHGVSAHAFFSLNWSVQSVNNQLFAFVTIGVIAIVTSTIACFYGLRAAGGPPGVGSVAARSLILNLVLVHAITAVLAVIYYGQNIQLPIGG